MEEYRSNTEIRSFLDVNDKTLKFETIQSGLFKKHFEEIVNFKEKTVREALIKLGWTPPEES